MFRFTKIDFNLGNRDLFLAPDQGKLLYQDFYGTSGNDSFVGTSGDDHFETYDGDDEVETLEGYAWADMGDGNDSVTAHMDGSGYIDGGDGYDIIQIFTAAGWQYNWNPASTEPVSDINTITTNEGEYEYTNFEELNVREDGTGQILSVMLLGDSANNVLNGTGYTGQVVITAGDGDDVLTGSSLGNFSDLYGGDGDDILNGGTGVDFLRGGDGGDALNGNAGNDWIIYFSSDAAINIYLATGAASGGFADGDTFSNVENISGSNGFGDTLRGDNNVNRIYGNGGDDILIGEGGNDTLNGGSGNDYLYSGDDDDTVDGGEGDDFASGWNGDDTINGDAGNDRLYGNDGNDTLFGNDGADFVVGGSGIDTMSGGSGGDILSGGAGADQMDGDTGNDKLYGGAGDDVLNGGEGNDILFGGGDNDTLRGSYGSDRLYGQSGDNIFDGGVGDDYYFGASGVDTYQFFSSNGAAVDRVSFFQAADVVELNGFGFANAAAAASSFAQSGSNVFFNSGAVMIVFYNAALADVQAAVTVDGLGELPDVDKASIAELASDLGQDIIAEFLADSAGGFASDDMGAQDGVDYGFIDDADAALV